MRKWGRIPIWRRKKKNDRKNQYGNYASLAAYFSVVKKKIKSFCICRNCQWDKLPSPWKLMFNVSAERGSIRTDPVHLLYFSRIVHAVRLFVFRLQVYIWYILLWPHVGIEATVHTPYCVNVSFLSNSIGMYHEPTNQKNIASYVGFEMSFFLRAPILVHCVAMEERQSHADFSVYFFFSLSMCKYVNVCAWCGYGFTIIDVAFCKSRQTKDRIVSVCFSFFISVFCSLDFFKSCICLWVLSNVPSAHDYCYSK